MTNNNGKQLPDRLCIYPTSPYFKEDFLRQSIHISIDDKERTDVEEYCLSEGWVRVAINNKTRDRFGRPMSLKLTGKVKAWIED